MRGMNLNVYLFEYNFEEISYQERWKKELSWASFFGIYFRKVEHWMLLLYHRMNGSGL